MKRNEKCKIQRRESSTSREANPSYSAVRLIDLELPQKKSHMYTLLSVCPHSCDILLPEGNSFPMHRGCSSVGKPCGAVYSRCKEQKRGSITLSNIIPARSLFFFFFFLVPSFFLSHFLFSFISFILPVVVKPEWSTQSHWSFPICFSSFVHMRSGVLVYMRPWLRYTPYPPRVHWSLGPEQRQFMNWCLVRRNHNWSNVDVLLNPNVRGDWSGHDGGPPDLS